MMRSMLQGHKRNIIGLTYSSVSGCHPMTWLSTGQQAEVGQCKGRGHDTWEDQEVQKLAVF